MRIVIGFLTGFLFTAVVSAEDAERDFYSHESSDTWSQRLDKPREEPMEELALDEIPDSTETEDIDEMRKQRDAALAVAKKLQTIAGSCIESLGELGGVK